MNQSSSIHANVTAREVLSHIPSASGVEIVNNHIYVIGDDSSFLYKLTADARLKEAIALFSTDSPASARIPKLSKPDFEAMTIFSVNGEKWLFVAGSGSLSPQRDKGYLINLSDPKERIPINLGPVYKQLRNIPEVVGEGKLNLEGAAATGEKLFLLQRGNISNKHILIQYDLAPFFASMIGQTTALPVPNVFSYTLPLWDGLQPGFSGVTALPSGDALLVTASLEDTANEIDDGAVMGSLLGIITLQNIAPEQLNLVPILYKEEIYPGKVESIAVEKVTGNTIHAIAVTDSDGGDSEILWLEISVKEEVGGKK